MSAATKQVSGVLRIPSAAVRTPSAAGDLTASAAAHSTRSSPAWHPGSSLGRSRRHYGPISVAWAGSLELRDRQVDCIITKISAAGATVRVYEPVVCLIAIVLHCLRLEPCR